MDAKETVICDIYGGIEARMFVLFEQWADARSQYNLLLLPLTTQRMCCSLLVRVHFECVPHVSTATKATRNEACYFLWMCCIPTTVKSARSLAQYVPGQAHLRFSPNCSESVFGRHPATNRWAEHNHKWDNVYIWNDAAIIYTNN